jgi:hypothetical protein
LAYTKTNLVCIRIYSGILTNLQQLSKHQRGCA